MPLLSLTLLRLIVGGASFLTVTLLPGFGSYPGLFLTSVRMCAAAA